MTTTPDPLIPLISSAMRNIDALDGSRILLSLQLTPDVPLHHDDLLAGPFPVSDYTFELLWRSSRQIDAWLLGAVASGSDGETLVDDLGSWAALLKDALELTAMAHWVLSPRDGRTRVTRRLDLELFGCRELRRAQCLGDLPTRSADDGTRLVRETARAAGLRVQSRFPLRAALAEAGPLCSGGTDLVAIHALLSLAAQGSRDALHSLGLVPIAHPTLATGWDQLATAIDGFSVGLSAAVTLLAATFDRHTDLARVPAATASTRTAAS